MEKTMDYSLRYFSDFWSFLKMAVTRKIEVGITSNFLHSIFTTISKDYNQNESPSTIVCTTTKLHLPQVYS